MTTKDTVRPSWSVEQRLEFIDYRLFWLGYINRSDLQNQFGISTPQASADFGKYQELAPHNIVYDPQGKRYVPGLGYSPKFYEPSARKYLLELRAVADEAIDTQNSWLNPPPPYSAAPMLRRPLDAKVLRKVLEAIRNQQGLNILYHSLSGTEPTYREIVPHALAFDGTRWHARAWSYAHSAFRDFVLARIHSVSEGGQQKISGKEDAEWQREFDLCLVPNPALSQQQQQTIAFDYGMEKSELVVRARICMTYYIEKNLLVDPDTDSLPADRRQLILKNRKDLQSARQEALLEAKRLMHNVIGNQDAAD